MNVEIPKFQPVKVQVAVAAVLAGIRDWGKLLWWQLGRDRGDRGACRDTEPAWPCPGSPGAHHPHPTHRQ